MLYMSSNNKLGSSMATLFTSFIINIKLSIGENREVCFVYIYVTQEYMQRMTSMAAVARNLWQVQAQIRSAARFLFATRQQCVYIQQSDNHAVVYLSFYACLHVQQRKTNLFSMSHSC